MLLGEDGSGLDQRSKDPAEQVKESQSAASDKKLLARKGANLTAALPNPR